jgi:cytochrome c peroxidase
LLCAALVAAPLVACSDRSESPGAVAEAGADAQPVDAAAPQPPDAAAADAPAPCPDAGPFPAGDALAVGRAIPNLGFDALAGDAITTTTLARYWRPCDRPGLLVLRASAAWCGPCRWHAAHTNEWLSARVGLLELLAADGANLPPDLDAMRGWSSVITASDRVTVARDPSFALRALNKDRPPLPLYVLVDTRTMVVRRVLADPDPDALAFWLAYDLAASDGLPPPPSSNPALVDGRFTRNQWDLVRDMTLPGAPPPDPTNAFADTPAAAALGKKLFSDGALSPSGAVSCASCHDPARDLSDGVPQSVAGVAHLDRNAPAIALAPHAPWQFWDGRADSLWMQALGPFESAKEFGGSRLFVDHAVFTKYRADYEAVFGPMPSFDDLARFPANGMPGTAAWAPMTPADQTAATRVFVNVGKAIAAFERTFRVGRSRFDDYVAGDSQALAPEEKDGLREFFIAGCAQCHYGPRLADDAFHDTRFPTGRQDGLADPGRRDGIELYAASEFHAGSVWSDAPSSSRLAALRRSASTLGAFKTPSLRAVPGSAPYGHGGTVATLSDVVALYRTFGVPADDARAAGTVEPWVASFGGATEELLPHFLGALAAPVMIP